MSVYFINDGVIDIRAIKTFGISAKEHDNPIGFFGTGLKYAIAILLRTGHNIVIYAGENTYIFSITEDLFRGKGFNFIKMNDDHLPFTTELGKNWELWQAYRELYCNALDENGKVSSTMPSIMDNSTIIEVSGPQIDKIHDNRDEIVIPKWKKPIFRNSEVELYREESNFIYYRGIQVTKTSGDKFNLTYNLLEETQLTEDRTIKDTSDLTRRMPRFISGLTDKDLILSLITNKNKAEYFFDFEWLEYYTSNISKEFEDVVSEMYRLNSDRCPISLMEWYKKKHKKENRKSLVPATLTDLQKKQLKRCKSICEKIYPLFKNYELQIVESLGEDTMGMASRTNNTMIISQRAFDNGTKYLLSTMIEEYFHLVTGYNDLTRSFQTYIFDQLCCVIESHVIKEPL